MPKNVVNTNDGLIRKYAEKSNSIKEQRKQLKTLSKDLKYIESQLITLFNVPDGESTTLESQEFTIQINRIKKKKAMTATQIQDIVRSTFGKSAKVEKFFKQIEAGDGDQESTKVAVKSK